MFRPLLSVFFLFLATNTASFAQEGTVSATTTPVGYMTQELPSSSTTYVGVSTHHPVLISSTATATTGTTLTDNSLNFNEILTAGEAYLLEIESGAYKGTVFVLNANKWKNTAQADEWNASTLTLPLDFSTSTPLEQNVAYKIRKAATVSDIFGAHNEVCTLTASTFFTKSDNISVTEYITDNKYNIFFNSSLKEWRTVSPSLRANKMPLFYQLPLSIKTLANSTTKSLTQIGEILTTEKAVEIKTAYDFIHTGYATAVPLAQSGIETGLTNNNFSTKSDKINLFDTTGSTTSFFFSPGAKEWKSIGVSLPIPDIKGPFAISRPTSNVSHKYIIVSLPTS